MYLWFARFLKKPSKVRAGECVDFSSMATGGDDVFPDPMGMLLLQVEYDLFQQFPFQSKAFCHFFCDYDMNYEHHLVTCVNVVHEDVLIINSPP